MNVFVKKISTIITAIAFIAVLVSNVDAQTVSPKIGVRGGLGTDIHGGIAYGVGGNYLLSYPNGGLELGVLLFGGSFEESSEDGYNFDTGAPHIYDETTDIFVFGLMANYLIGYDQSTTKSYFIVGAGLASISVDWEEKSATDGSLGTIMPGGGSMQSESASGAGTVFNLGVGKSFSENFDMRVEFPTIVTFSTAGNASAVIPTFIVTAGFRF